MQVLFERNVLAREAVEISDEILRLFIQNGQEEKLYSRSNIGLGLRFTTVLYTYIFDDYTFFFDRTTAVDLINPGEPRHVAMKLSFYKEDTKSGGRCYLLWFNNIFSLAKVKLYTNYNGERVRTLPINMNKINLNPLGPVWRKFCSIEDWKLLEYETNKPGNWVAYSPLLSGKVPLSVDSEFKISIGPDENAEVLLRYLKKNLDNISDDHIKEMVVDFFDNWPVGKVEQTRTDLLTMICKNPLDFYMKGACSKGKSDYLNHWIRIKKSPQI